MNKAIISIGSNEDRENNLRLCRKLLEEEFESVCYSPTSFSLPYGEQYKEDFLNQMASFQTEESKDTLIQILKSIEIQMGRKPSDKTEGKVIIDVDLVIWNDEILRPNEMQRSYIKDLLDYVEE